MAKGIICECNRSHGTTQRTNLTHVPRHHKSRPRLGQGSKVLWMRIFGSGTRDVGGSRVDMYVVLGRCDVRSCCR